ncbi:MAG: hypothetical protein PHE29_05345 [Tissierellia bacterium]|nr:hypothetical protein [Tissierellia bacterium]MDD4780600.1 hypothetical protein [Tissierellia bacterium]
MVNVDCEPIYTRTLNNEVRMVVGSNIPNKIFKLWPSLYISIKN